MFAVHSFLHLLFTTIMKFSIFAAAAALAGTAFGADAVKGAAEGFAKGVTGKIDLEVKIGDYILTDCRWWFCYPRLPFHHRRAHQLPR